MQKQPTQPRTTLRLKGLSSFNSRATKNDEIRGKLGVKKPVIHPRSKEKIVKEEIKKNHII